MSFILDALKKLEEKRRTEPVPDLMTVHPEGREEKSRPLLTYLLVAVLLLNAVILAAWLLRPQENGKAVSAAESAVESVKDDTGQMKAEPAVIKEQKTVEEAPVPETEAKEIPAPEKDPLPLTLSPEELNTLRSSIAEEQLTADDASVSEPDMEEEITPDTGNTVLDISRLPLSIREGLPTLDIKGHIYSNDPMSRLVNINGNIIHEGETVTAGLKVNEITMSGVVFDYNGLFFSVRAF